ncbi:MAG: DUF3368 domain-containing protein [Chloroflexi bacterium]|nr:DUF3368 domain-containing protein [Chloroflexota bacterium]
MQVVPDASPLIALSKMERVFLLAKLYGEVVVTPEVWEEAVTKGKAMGARDAAYLEQSARQHAFVRARLTAREREIVERIRDDAELGLGEAEVLAVAENRNALAVLDEKAARAVAVGLGVAHTGTAGLLFEAAARRLVDYEELVELLEQLARVAWVSPELLARVLKRAKEIGKQ